MIPILLTQELQSSLWRPCQCFLPISLGIMLFSNLLLPQNLDGLVQLDHATATYCLVVKNEGDVLLGIGDMDINSKLTIDDVSENGGTDINNKPLVIL